MRAFGVRSTVVVVLLLAVLPLLGPPVAAETAQEEAAPDEMSETFRIGPFDLAPQGQPGDQVNRIFEDAPRPDGDLAIRSIRWNFVDSAGDPIPGDVAHLHHIVLLDSARPDQLCSFPSQSRFASTGKELNDLVLPDGYAYHAPDAPWSSVYHVMNMSDAPVTASIEYTITWTDPAEGGYLDVEPYFFDVTGCWGNSEYTVPGDGGPGSIHEQSRAYTIDRDGVAVVAGGHIHAGAIDIYMSRNGDELCRAEAVYHDGDHGGHHSLAGITPCGVLGEPLSAGDEIELVSRYRNDMLIPGAMGIMVTYVHHTGPPPPPPTLEVRSVGLDGGTLTGEVVCNRPLQVTLDGSVSQDKGGPSIDLYGYTMLPISCGPDPVPFSLELTYGNGVLTGGTVEYSVHGWSFDGRVQVSDTAFGETRSSGRFEPSGAAPEPTGPLPISIDGAGSSPASVEGTVTCEVPTGLYVDVMVTQRVGRHLVEAYGGTALECDGETAFDVPVQEYDGRLSGGPVDVVVHAYDPVTFQPSIMTGTVVLTGSGPPTGTALPPSDPDSPAQIGPALAVPGGVEVTVTYSGCPAGAHFYVDVTAREAHPGKGRRVTDDRFLHSSVGGTCDGSLLSVPVLVPADDDVKALETAAYVYWFEDFTWAEGSASNTATLTVERG